MKRANKTDAFLKELLKACKVSLPAVVTERTKCALLDYVGVTIAGASVNSEKIDAYLSWISDSASVRAIGVNRTVSLKDAVFLNGLNAHTLDMDDGTNAGIIHLGSPIFSLLLPLAAQKGGAGSALLKAAAAGYEAAWTLAVSMQPKHKTLGYHATGTCGLLGAVFAGAHYLSFSYDELFRAFSIGCVSAGGTLKVIEDGSELKPYNVAKASLLALMSLQMAKAGFRVPDDAMAGDRGFLKMMAGNEDIDIVEPLRGGLWAIMRTYTKPYAACRYCHPAIEAAIGLAREENIPIGEIKHVEVRTYELAVSGHDHTAISGSSSAKMSIPYGVAVGYLRGKAGLAEYAEETVRDSEVLALCSKVSVMPDLGFTKAFPEKTGATVTLETRDGSTFERCVDYPLGEPENPLGLEDIKYKFREMSAFAGMSDGWQEDVIRAVFNIEDDLPRLLKILERRTNL